MIKRLKIAGYKSHCDFDQPLTPLTVILGPNDSGKSSLLEALMTLAQIIAAPINQVLVGDSSLRLLAWRGFEPPSIRWEVTLEPLRADGSGHGYYVLGLEQEREMPRIRVEQVSYNQRLELELLPDGRRLRDGAGNVVLASSEPMVETGLLVRRDQPGISEIADALSATRHHQFDPSALSLPSPFVPGDGELALDMRGFGLPSLLAALKLADYPRFHQIEEALKKTIPSIESIIIRPSTVRVPLGVYGGVDRETRKGTHLRRQPPREEPGHRLAFAVSGGWEIPAEHASAGVLLFLGYLTLVFSERPPHLLLLEEPENGIHPRRLKTVVNLLRKLTEGVNGMPPTQVILTTHSPYLLDFVNSEEVLICRKQPDESTQVARMADAPDLEARLGEQQLGELWFNVGEEILSGATKIKP